MQGREELFERDRYEEPVPGGTLANWLVPKWSERMPEHSRNPNCEIEYAASWSDQGLPCAKRAVAGVRRLRKSRL